MVRRLVPIVVLLATVLYLPAAALAGPDSLTRKPPPDQVASWILGGDPGEVELAINTLHGAPKAYLTAVLRSVRAQRAGSLQPTGPVAAAEASTVLLEVRVYAGRRGLAKRLLGEARMRGTHLLGAPEAEALGEDLVTREQARALHAPSLVVADRQWGTVKVTTPVSYVKSFRVEGRPGDTVRSPQLDIVEEGLVLEVRPVVSADGRFVTLAGALTQTAVERPIPRRTVRLEDGTTAEIEAPTVREARLDLHFTLPDGDSIAGTGLVHPLDSDQELLVLVSVHRLGQVVPLVPTPPRAEAPGTRVVTLEVRLLRAGRGVLERVLGAAVPCADEPLCALEAADVVRLLGPGRRGVKGVEILSAPRLTTFDGQQANVSVLNQTSYVKDYTVERSGEKVMLDPVVDTLQDGLVFDVTPRITADRTRIALATVTTWADLTRPIAKFQTTIEGQEVTLEIPELKVSRIANDFELAAGGYALIGGFDDDAEGRRTCVLLHASVTDLDEEERLLRDK